MLAIDVRDVSVCYRMPVERIPTFKEFAIKWLRGRVRFRHLMALSEVNLQVRQGERVGIIGRNGAGKSTLLKVIARVLRPTTGTVLLRGFVAPLLELGAGFVPDLSGRENVYLNGSILGRSRKHMHQRFADIVAFAELEDFIDAPLRTYSTGMITRLGFSVATDVDPDILLIDEVLSVGDLQFQRKCQERIQSFRQSKTTMILVSHAPQTVRLLCDRTVWLDHGKIVADGPSEDVLTRFLALGATPASLAAAS